jgi:hypothetical protein
MPPLPFNTASKESHGYYGSEKKKLSNKVSEKVYQYIHNNDASIYWSNKLGPNAHVTDIDWDAISVA